MLALRLEHRQRCDHAAAVARAAPYDDAHAAEQRDFDRGARISKIGFKALSETLLTERGGAICCEQYKKPLYDSSGHRNDHTIVARRLLRALYVAQHGGAEHRGLRLGHQRAETPIRGE